MKLLFIVLAGTMSMSMSIACRDNAKEASRKADEQRIEAEFRAREEQRAADERARADKLENDKRTADQSFAIAKEKSDMRAAVQEWLSSLDKYLAELQRGTKDSKNGDDQRGLLAFKETLTSDLGAIDRATEPEWPSVKIRVERDIEGAKKRIADLGMVAKVNKT